MKKSVDLLQPVGDGAVGIEPLPVVRGEHLLRLEGLVDVGQRCLAVVSLLQRFHRLIAVGDDVIIGFGPALDQLDERFLVGLVIVVGWRPSRR